jgi:hypothetical protein
MTASIKFEFDGLERARSNVPLIAGIEANFRVIVDGTLFVSEPFFNVVELAAAFLRWTTGNFVFESMDAEEPLLLFRSTDHDILTIESPWQRFDCKAHFRRDTLVEAATRFTHELEQRCLSELAIRIRDALRSTGT